ncbi:phosphate acetyltransferase [Geodermatophilus pulveris]|uniref:Phosphate acetyltransferase n=1 Tax=Geodermatophilus pulveris TaxID=1564159 RepID=A0A239HN63_9ACTN|nr:phosphate acetyltransferase [Geodermatophilus pulveris]
MRDGASAGTEVRVSDGLYVTGCEPGTGKSAVALGVFELLARRVGRLGVFRPVVTAADGADRVVDLLLPRSPEPRPPYEACLGVPYADVLADEDRAVSEVVDRYRALAARCDRVLVVGTDFTEAGAAGELALNARIAVNLGLPVLAVVSGHDRTAAGIRSAADVGVAAMRSAGCEVVAVVANRVDPREVAAAPATAAGGLPVWALPEAPVLTAPTVAEIAEACDGELLAGDAATLSRETSGVLVGAMTLPNLLDRLVGDVVVITPGDRADVLLGVLAAHLSGGLPAPAGVVLTGGIPPAPRVLELVETLPTGLPVVLTAQDTYATASTAAAVPGRITPEATRKVDTALALFEAHVDGADLLDRVAVSQPRVRTPLMFEYELLDRARSDRRRIVLPEGTDERVLRAAEKLLRRGVVDLTLLGAPEEVRAAAARAGVDVEGAELVDPFDPELRERNAVEYARRRAHKGVPMDQARDVVVDVSYAGTLMVALGTADGMVSGAAHTTAHTIRPALEVIRTVEGVPIVSSVFFMCLADRVLVYGDCAVNVHPTAEQLAAIAVSSGRTAAQFGVEPRVAMLSYSTGRSGSGADVDRVRAATDLVRQQAPDLSVEGPIQYDAAVDASVARAKLPGSAVAGRATVFVFPDLNTGNNTYKAVQRSAGAVAVGPVLQGLRRPVNDLSRGATVQDIVNTVAITAIQAQRQAPQQARP